MQFESYAFERVDGQARLVTVAGRCIGDRAGKPVALIASLGRGGSDFDTLAADLAAQGHFAILPDPRGIGASTGPMEDVSFDDLAADVIAALENLTRGPVALVGHALGNRVSRMVAARRPDLISRIVLLACGGQVEPAADKRKALFAVFDESLSPEEHLENVRIAFFAEGNDPEPWRDGWHSDVALMQREALMSQPFDIWIAGGGRPILIVQAREDAIAPAANAEALKADLGDQVRIVELEGAGHAILPEQPARVSEIVLAELAQPVPE